MEKDSIGGSASFREGERSATSADGTKRRRLSACFYFMEISIDPAAVKSLKQLNSDKFKDEIQKWAKAVVSYARQVSYHFSSSRKPGPDE